MIDAEKANKQEEMPELYTALGKEWRGNIRYADDAQHYLVFKESLVLDALVKLT